MNTHNVVGSVVAIVFAAMTVKQRQCVIRAKTQHATDVAGAIISYDEVEDANVTLAPAGPVVITGTGGDDDITVLGTGANSLNVTVNNGPGSMSKLSSPSLPCSDSELTPV